MEWNNGFGNGVDTAGTAKWNDCVDLWSERRKPLMRVVLRWVK